jgi:phospholipid/cholesterol/gamma-HCH transport system substrate-binding protein
MNQFTKTIKNNLFPFIVLMILVVGCGMAWYLFHPSSPYHKRYSFVVSYQEIGTLSPGNRVVVRGIAKGQILKVELTDDAVFVKVEVLADAKISRHSEFRLINAGLMGEREMNILTAEDDDWIVDGDTVYGAYDDGIAGVGVVFLNAVADLDTMQQQIVALKDSLTVGSSGKKIERIVKKGKRLVNAGTALVNDTRDEALAVLDKAEGTLQKIRTEIDDASNHGAATVEKGSALLNRIDELLNQVKDIKADVDALAARLDAKDNTVGLVNSGKGKLVNELDKLAKDIDSLTKDIKKNGLKLNIDIF